MPTKRSYTSVPIRIADGGRLVPDLPVGTIGPANFTEKVNFRSDIGEVVKSYAWDYPAPTDDWFGVLLETFDESGPAEAIRGVRRPNGTYAVVGCGGGLIKAYQYETGWVTIGSGFSTSADAGFRYWQIEDIAGYAVFNNGRDLPVTWQIGDAAVTPLYEMREAGYASVGLITEYVDGVLFCADVLEINDAAMSAVMNDPLPYKTITDALRIDSGNLLAEPNDLATAAWTRTNETPSTGSGTLPDGSTGDFTILTFNAANVARYTEQAVTVLDGELLTVTAYFQPRFVSGKGRVVVGDNTLGVIAAQAEFDTDGNAGAGSVAVSALAGAPTDMQASIEQVSGSWYRIILTARLAGVMTARVRLQVASSAGAYVFSGLESHAWWGVALTEEEPGTTRITYRRIWSNIGNPRDFAVTVPGSIDIYADPTELTLAWPMASLGVGDIIIVVGAAADGGNLQTAIAAIDGVSVTLAEPASISVTDAEVARPTDVDSIAGYDDIEDDGSAIVFQIRLKTQLISFKASGHIWQTYYTGDLDTPFAKDGVTREPGAAPMFPRAITNVLVEGEEYLLYPGANSFYRFDLGSQAPVEHPLFLGAQKDLFYSRIAGCGPYDVWAAKNACTKEIFFAYRWQAYEVGYYGASRALAFRYATQALSLADVSDFNFACAATIQKPLAAFTCDEVESWFVMGAGDGRVTLYGETNLAVLTRQRYGENFSASLAGGLFAPAGASDTGSYVRRFSLDPSNPDASAATTVSILGARSPNSPPTVLETKTLTDPRFPGCMGLYYRKPFFGYRLSSETSAELRISGFIWRVGATDTQDIDRLQ